MLKEELKNAKQGKWQKVGINYDELYALVSQMKIIRLLISLVAQNK